MLADHIGVPQLRDLAGRSAHIVEDIRIGGMDRLAGFLHSEGTEADTAARSLSIDARFAGNLQGYPEIDCTVSGSLPLCCQRCLERLDWPVDLEFRLVVVESEDDVDQIAEPFDAVVADEHGIDFAKIVEDELLGSLPLAPMHEQATGESGAPRETHKPFATLAVLMEATSDADDSHSQ